MKDRYIIMHNQINRNFAVIKLKYDNENDTFLLVVDSKGIDAKIRFSNLANAIEEMENYYNGFIYSGYYPIEQNIKFNE